MNGFSLLLAVASLNVVYTWRTGVDQQQEYVLQIEPEIVQRLKAGQSIDSEIPADAGPFQRLCIQVLAKDGTPVRHSAAGEEQFRQLVAAAGRFASLDRTPVKPDVAPNLLWSARGAVPEQTYGVTTGWQPDKTGAQQYLVQIDPAVLDMLALGDELYVPIDPAAGRVAAFVVKAGSGNLPRLGGIGAGSLGTDSRYGSPQTQTPSPRGNRFGGVNDTGAWDNARYGDATRLPGRTNTGTTDYAYNEGTTTPRTSNGGVAPGSQNQFGANQYAAPPAFGAPPGTSYPPYGGSPATTYPASAQATTPQNYLDQYRGATAYPPAGQPGHALTPGQSGYLPPPPGYPVQQVSSQQPQLPPTTTQFQPQYPDARVAAMPPTTTTGANTVTPSLGFSPGITKQAQQDKPWGPLLFVAFALFFSIGGNLYLAYTALEYHSRYRSAIERLRAAARTA